MNIRTLSWMLLIQTAFLAALPLAHAEDSGTQPSAPIGQSCTAAAKRMARLELIFGVGGKAGPVSRHAWSHFVDREITPRFPDGLTIFEGYGQWRNQHGAIGKEPSRLLLIWYVPDAISDEKIEAIRSAYKRRFHQDSVLRADEISCVSF